MKQEPEIVSAIVEMYLSGKEQKEIVEVTGRDFAFVRYWLKKKGIFNPERRKHGNSFIQYNQVKEQEAESRLAFLLLEKGFFYIGKAEKERRIILSCLVCGESFERFNDKHFRESAIECPHCLKVKKEQKRKERQTVRDNRKIKELEKQSLEKLGGKKDAIIKEKLTQDTTEKGCICRLHGHWIGIKDGSYECEFCHHQITGIPQDLNFCCKCGAELKMI